MMRLVRERSTPEPAPAGRRTFVIIGGGFAGTAVAIALLRRPAGIDVVVVDATGSFARGVAHATRDPLHLLNVPAGRMSLDPDRPGAFVDWLRSRRLTSSPDDYVARGTYGDYLHASLEEAARAGAGHGSTLRLVTATATGVVRSTSGERVVLEDGGVLDADEVVLALGAPRACRIDALPNDPEVHDDPWSRGALDPMAAPGGRVLLVGSGLTAVDAAMRLAHDDPALHVTMVSRHGLLPHAHIAEPLAPVAPPAWPGGPLALDTLVDTVHAHVRDTVAAGRDWRAAIDSLRPQLPDLWHRLGPAGQREFLGSHVRRWEVRRHRMAPQVAERISAMRAEGRLVVMAAAVAAVAREDAGLRVQLEGASPASLLVDRVIACTGPSPNLAADGPAVVRTLCAAGRAQLDPLGLGLRADATGRLLDAAGTPSPSLWLLGALRRGELWESTAVPELRVQAVRIVEAIHAGLRD